MNWYVADAVGEAFKRTRKCLLEPFELIKWFKLAIIVALAGGGVSSGYNGSHPIPKPVNCHNFLFLSRQTGMYFLKRSKPYRIFRS
ncbi:MAG: DUF7544 domain-containing protein [Halobacteriota archaeon]